MANTPLPHWLGVAPPNAGVNLSVTALWPPAARCPTPAGLDPPPPDPPAFPCKRGDGPHQAVTILYQHPGTPQGVGMNARPPAGRRGRLETVPGPERRDLCRTSDAQNGRRPGPWPRAETGPRSARSGPGRPPPAASCSAPGPPRRPTPRGGPGCGLRSPKWN